MVFPRMTFFATSDKSAFSSTITGDLPPNSKVTGTRLSEAAFITFLPICVPPVKSK